jgi:hypothetical protein
MRMGLSIESVESRGIQRRSEFGAPARGTAPQIYVQAHRAFHVSMKEIH